MKRLLSITLIVVLVATMIFVGCAKPAPAPTPAPSPAPTPEKMNLSFATVWPEPSPQFQRNYKHVLDEIEEKSNGRITFTVYAGGSLVSGPETWDAIRTGMADSGQISPSYTPGRTPLTDVLTFPGAYDTTDASEEMAMAVFDRILYKEYANVHVIGLQQTERFFLYFANKQVRKLEDMKGLKIRSGGGLNSPTIEALGGTPVIMGLGDIYLSVQTGLIDGIVCGCSGNLSFNLQEVLHHDLRFPVGFLTNLIVVNLDTWEKIPDDLKPMMEEAGKWIAYEEVRMFEEHDPAWTKLMIDAGGTSYTLPPDEEARWIDALASVVDKWVADLEAKGLPGQETLDIVREECQKRNVPFPY